MVITGAAGSTLVVVVVEVEEVLPELPPEDPPPVVCVVEPAMSASNCALVTHVDEPPASSRQSFLAYTVSACMVVANKSAMPLPALASQVVTRAKRFTKKLSAKDREVGVELAVVEARVSRLRFNSCIALVSTGVSSP